MTPEEKQTPEGKIIEAAEKHSGHWKQYASNHYDWIKNAFIAGAKSDAAKEFHAPKWISIYEHKPKTGDVILGYSNDGIIEKVFVYGEKSIFYETSDGSPFYNLSHWTELPLPPAPDSTT